MNRELIARELIKVARELTGGWYDIGSNFTSGDGDGQAYAWLYSNERRDVMLLVREKIGGRQSDTEYPAGTLDAPKLKVIDSALRKHQPEDTKWSRTWAAKKGSLSTKDLIAAELARHNRPIEDMRKKIVDFVGKADVSQIDGIAKALGFGVTKLRKM